MFNHRYEIGSVGFCFLFTSEYSDRLSKLGYCKERSVIYDGTGCHNIKQKFNLESTTFLAVVGGIMKGIQFKTWFEIIFFIWSRRLQKCKEKKLDEVFTTTCPWFQINWTELGVGRLLPCGEFLLYGVSVFSGLAMKLYWVCWRLFAPLVHELLDLSWWYCLSGFQFLSGLKKTILVMGFLIFLFHVSGLLVEILRFLRPKV